MNDERLFELLASHAGPAAVDDDFEARLYTILQREMRPALSLRPALLLVAALVAVLTIGAAIAVGSGLIKAPWDDLTPSASPLPSTTTEILVFPDPPKAETQVPVTLYAPGRYFIATVDRAAYDWFGLDVSAVVPHGWNRGEPYRGDFGLWRIIENFDPPLPLPLPSPNTFSGRPLPTDRPDPPPPPPDWRMELQFWMVDNVTAGGCVSGWPHAGLDPPVGPKVHDLASALTSLPGFQATTPVDVTLDGWHGKRLNLTVPENFDCDLELFGWSRMPDPSWTEAAGVPGTHQLWILDVDGIRFVIDAAYDAGTPVEMQAELLQIVESIEIQPPGSGT
jgi:hypothetical protein